MICQREGRERERKGDRQRDSEGKTDRQTERERKGDRQRDSLTQLKRGRQTLE